MDDKQTRALINDHNTPIYAIIHDFHTSIDPLRSSAQPSGCLCTVSTLENCGKARIPESLSGLHSFQPYAP
jgi:hypothetical protein